MGLKHICQTVKKRAMIHLKHKNAFITGGTKGIVENCRVTVNNGVSVAFTGRDEVSVNRTEKH